MRILAVTNMYPTPHAPASGVFVEQQIKGLKQIGLEVDIIFIDRTQKGMGAYLGLRRHLRAKIAHFRPDIVHVMYGGVMADQVTQAVYNSPTVVTFHGSDLLGEHLSGAIRKLLASYGVWASWRAARRATGIVVVSKILQDTLPKDVVPSKTRLIPCGIDLDRFKPLDRDVCRSSLGWSSEYFHVLFPTNTGDPVKRPGLARATVEAGNRLGIHAEMHQLQNVPNHQVPVWLNASDVVLLTSLHEGSPTIIKEALACNVPVVSVDVGDVCEHIKGIEGCYLALPDPEDLADKLLLVYTGSRRVEGRSNIQKFSLERIALRLKEFYGEVVAGFSG